MKSKNKVFLFIVLILIAINGYYYILAPMYSESSKDLEYEIAAHTLNSDSLVKAFQINEEKTSKLYVDKIVEISGTVKEITYLNNRSTIVLESNTDRFGVICDVNPKQESKLKLLKKNQKIRVKGICKGFLKDVIILNCSIDLLTNE